jgi:uncharacterized iron-regulated protein
MKTCRRCLVAVILLAIAVAGCRSVTAPAIAWQSPVGRDHALAGRIWDVRGARFVDEPAFLRQLRDARFVLLGETHDNPDHHALQARVVQALVAAGRRPALAFEMLTPSQGPALTRHLAAHPRDAAGIGTAVGWASSGWPRWSLYEPIARAAVDAGLPIVPANLADERLRAMRNDGIGSLDPAFVARYALDAPLPDDVRVAMTDEIRDAHCGHASPGTVTTMVAMQRARDASIASAMLAAPGTDGAILIAGSGHVRTDRGVYIGIGGPDMAPKPPIVRSAPANPWHSSTAAVAFLEVDPRRADPASYGQRFGGPLPFDYVWFTPGAAAEDPCEKFRKNLERLRR